VGVPTVYVGGGGVTLTVIVEVGEVVGEAVDDGVTDVVDRGVAVVGGVAEKMAGEVEVAEGGVGE